MPDDRLPYFRETVEMRTNPSGGGDDEKAETLAAMRKMYEQAN